MQFWIEGKVAERTGLAVPELRALVEEHGSALGVERNGRRYVNLLALDRIQKGLPSEAPTDRELTVLFQELLDALLAGKSDARDRLDRLILELTSLRLFRQIGSVIGASDPQDVEGAG